MKNSTPNAMHRRIYTLKRYNSLTNNRLVSYIANYNQGYVNNVVCMFVKYEKALKKIAHYSLDNNLLKYRLNNCFQHEWCIGELSYLLICTSLYRFLFMSFLICHHRELSFLKTFLWKFRYISKSKSIS